MKSFTRFTRRTDNPSLEAEFRRAYQEAGVLYLLWASLMAFTGFSAFYLLDMAYGKPGISSAAQAMRPAIALLFALVALTLRTRQALSTRYYTALANIIFATGILMAVWVSAEIHQHDPVSDLLWNMNTSILTPILVIFAFSRLTFWNTTAIVAVGSLVSLAALHALAAPLEGIARVAVDVIVVATIGLTFRVRGELREWDLFLLAKENLNNSEGNRTKMRFLANMSHEVRTPVSGLLQVMDLLLPSAAPKDRQLIAASKASASALLKILNAILDYSALSSEGTARVIKAPTDLAAVCRTALSLHLAALRAKNLELRVRMDLGPTDVRVLADSVMLFEILNNLISNALKFTTAGFLELAVELLPSQSSPHPQATFAIQLADSGIGISEENLARIFQPFFQVDTSMSRRVGGTGLGLSIVKGLVDALGGTIKASSQLGVGTTLRVELPVEIISDTKDLGPPNVWEHSYPDDAGGCETGSPLGADQRLSGRILLVEDNACNVLLYSRYLASLGLEVDAASNGLEAVDQARRSNYAVILMDIQMPGKDGIEAAQDIRNHEKSAGGGRTPIIAFTANSLKGDRERYLSAGMDDYYDKASDINRLRSKLARWLNSDHDALTHD